jgi:hypothetical protein
MNTTKYENFHTMPAKETVGLDPSQDTVVVGKPPRIGGFLVVVAVSLFISLIQNLAYFLRSIVPIIRTSLWERMTDPESIVY